jgi:hypothetical protein
MLWWILQALHCHVVMRRRMELDIALDPKPGLQGGTLNRSHSTDLAIPFSDYIRDTLPW